MNVDRRQWLLSQPAALGTAWLSASCATPFAPTIPATITPIQNQLIKPMRLQRGDTVALISPSGWLDPAQLQRRVTQLEELGFSVKTMPNVLARWGGYAGTIEQRVSDLHQAFADPVIKGIFVTRGGSGATGLLPHVNFDLIRRNPKVFIGFSDTTALLLAMRERAGLVCFHGPTAGSSMTEFTVRQLRAVLMEPVPSIALKLSQEHQWRAIREPHMRFRSLNRPDGSVPTTAQGELVGGNLSLIAALAGTVYLPSLRNKIIFLEDVGEPPYRIDRLLHQLQQLQPYGLATAAAVVIGFFSRTQPPDDQPTLSVDEVLEAHFQNFQVPAVYGFSFGHEASQLTLPIGIQARLDTVAQTLSLLEAPTS